MVRELSRIEAAGLNPSMVWPRGADPISQASLWTPMRLYPWQASTIRKCMVRGARVSLVTPNESGKTSGVIPVLGLSFMAAFPGAQVVSTAGVERQIKKQLWPCLRSAVGRYPRWQITEDLKIKAPSVRGIPGSEWEAFTTKDPEYAEGFHPRWVRDEDGNAVYCPLMIIIDEAKSFDNPEMMRTFVNRCDPDILLMASTPGSDSGPFYDSFHKDRHLWDCVEVTWKDCPHLRVGVKLEKRVQLIQELGENHPFVLSWVFGQFSRRGERLIFDNMDDVSLAMSSQIPWKRGRRSVSMDFSGGGDEQVFCWGVGNRIMPLEIFHEPDSVKLAEEFVRKLKGLGVEGSQITADNGGLGKVVIDVLEARGFPGIKRYMSNDKARRDDLYQYRVTEDHYELRERLLRRSLVLPLDEKLKDQMRKRRYLIRNEENLIQIEPKEKLRNRGESSPDRLDAVVMLCAEMEPPGDWVDRSAELAGQRSKCGDYRECFKAATVSDDDGSGGFWSSGLFDE